MNIEPREVSQEAHIQIFKIRKKHGHLTFKKLCLRASVGDELRLHPPPEGIDVRCAQMLDPQANNMASRLRQ